MTTAPQDPNPGDFTPNERRALVRQLTHMLNQRETDKRQFMEHFGRYGVLLEGVLTQLDKQGREIDQLKDLVTRVYQLGIWWEQDECDRSWAEEASNA